MEQHPQTSHEVITGPLLRSLTPPNASTTVPLPTTSDNVKTNTTSSSKTKHSDPKIILFPESLQCSFKSKVGEGSYGKVYLVTDEKTSTLKAVKAYNLEKLKPDYREKFACREIDLLLKISHPNIIGVSRMVKTGTFIYIVMDFAACKDLEHYIRRGCVGIIEETQAAKWIRQIANALEYLHEVGIVHRDLKCDNILVTQHLNAKLTDFGFSRIVRTSRELCSTFCGTLTYAAPEVIKNDPYNPRCSDIWSLGVVMFRILNKAYPFGSPDISIKDRLRRQESREYKFSKAYETSVEAKQLVARMLDPNPRHRISAKDIQYHAWIQNKLNDQVPTNSEKEALKYGILHGKELIPMISAVQMLISPDPAVNLVMEFNMKVFPDIGEIVSEENVRKIICKDISLPETSIT